MPIRCLLLILISLWLPAATAQSAFTLQGELREAGVPADGSYDFRLTLFAATAPVPEKGLVPIGVPRLVTDVPVIDGIFTVVVEPGAGFRGQDLQLGIEVRRSGEAEFEALTPYQTVHAVPYALFATDTSEDSVRGSSIVDRSIATVDLGEYAVTRFNITPGAIGTEQLDTASVTTMKLADGAVTRDKLAAGAIGPEHIDASQVQLRVAAQCPAGLPLVGIQIDGDPICDQQRRSLEGGTRSDDVAGFALDLSLRGDDRPILVYSLDDTPPAAGSSEPDFVILDCLDPVCQSATRREIVDTAALTAPDGIRVAMTLGAPLIALSSGGSLFTYRCTTSGCLERPV